MFPQHIKKWFFAWAALSVRWFTISFIQLIVLAVGVVCALWVFSTFNRGDAKWVWLVLAIIVFIIFVIIAFFNVSELNLLAFIAKKIKDNFLDVTHKVQVNYVKQDPIEVLISKSKQEKWKQRIEIKEELDADKLSAIEKSGIL